jgi:hypothetical protein
LGCAELFEDGLESHGRTGQDPMTRAVMGNAIFQHDVLTASSKQAKQSKAKAFLHQQCL